MAINMNKDLPMEAQARFKRFDAHLPSSDDPTLIVLKGHLLAEEILENLIKAKCKHPEALDHVEIGFFLKAKLAHALIGNTHENGLILPESVWEMLGALNSLRNELAHSLEPKNWKQKFKNFFPTHQPPTK